MGKTLVQWFGVKMTYAQIAEKYDIHRVTVSSYFRRYKGESKDKCNELVLKRIMDSKNQGPGNYFGKKMKKITSSTPRKRVEDIPSGTDYERKMWGY